MLNLTHITDNNINNILQTLIFFLVDHGLPWRSIRHYDFSLPARQWQHEIPWSSTHLTMVDLVFTMVEHGLQSLMFFSQLIPVIEHKWFAMVNLGSS